MAVTVKTDWTLIQKTFAIISGKFEPVNAPLNMALKVTDRQWKL